LAPDFFSNIGGLLGLVLCVGIVSFVEVVWIVKDGPCTQRLG
jgi:hypothetical protein